VLCASTNVSYDEPAHGVLQFIREEQRRVDGRVAELVHLASSPSAATNYYQRRGWPRKSVPFLGEKLYPPGPG
jgi:hypothetical protein